MQYQYPKTTLPPRKIIADIVPATIDGGLQITATDSFSAIDTSFWQIDLQDIPVAAPSQKLAWRALSLNLNGRLAVANVPIYEEEIAPWPLDTDGKPIYPWLTGFSDGTFFSDGLGFSDSTITAVITSPVAAGATQLSITLSADPLLPQPLAEGMAFSVVGRANTRLYRIESIVHASTDLTEFTVKIRPPVREVIGGGVSAAFSDPRCSCRLADDQQMFSGADDYAARTLASLSFVEAINP